MESLFTAQNIIQGGGVVVALSVLWVLYKVITNHYTHVVEALEKLTATQNTLCSHLKEQVTVTKALLDFLKK